MTILIAGLFTSQAWSSAILYFEPLASSINVGESVDVDVVIAGLDCGTDVAAFDFNVAFDDTVLAFDSYSLTDNLGVIPVDADDWSWGDLGGGTVNLSELSYLWDFSFQPDSFTLATLSFTGIGAGTSLLGFEYGFSPYYLSDAWGYEIFTLPGIGAVCVNPVPEPGTFILLGAGIVGLAGIRARRNKKA